MRSFFRGVLATIVGLFIFIFLLFFILAGIGSPFSTKEQVEVKDNSVLVLDLNQMIMENPPENPFEDLEFFSSENDRVSSLVKIKNAIKQATDDERIKGIFMKMGVRSPGFAIAEEIRSDLEAFKSSGKWVIAYGEYMSEGAYYLATAANTIFLHPEGNLEFNGLKAELLFFKGTMEKLGIEPQIFRVGKYKSAVEPLFREDMSEENRQQIGEYLESLNETMLVSASEARDINIDELRRVADQMLVRGSETAKEYQLIDEIMYYDEVEEWIKEKIELEEDDKIEFISAGEYSDSDMGGSSDYTKDKVAVIVAEGEIVSGSGGNDNIGSDKYAREIRKARKDDKVKAIVLRINSPGGSALASDVIWREVILAKEKKPVIASMSNVAASGGYYMAMAADTIVAWPNTITGSIGIFGVVLNMQEFFDDKLGITSDVVATGEFSDIFTISRPLKEQEKAIIQGVVEDGYETFTSKAAEGRGMELEKLMEVAQGRVWTGIQAKDRNLTDLSGGYDLAIDVAAEKAGLGEDEYRVVYYPKQKPFFEQFFEDVFSSAKLYILTEDLGEYAGYIERLKRIKNFQGVQARLPYDLEIE
jgi:protease-4